MIGWSLINFGTVSIEKKWHDETLKIRRAVVMERYHDIINGMFDSTLKESTCLNETLMDVFKLTALDR